MKKWSSLLLALLLALSLCFPALAEDVTYPSRGVDVPATVVLPEKVNDDTPFVVLIHGHGGGRHENVGFGAIADALAKKGIASIRMDLPGNGDSKESFQLNTMTNMKQDVLAAIAYMRSQYKLDDDYGVMGYSMGGRIILELMAEGREFEAALLLAPAADNEDLKLLFGGPENWESLRATAEKDGFVTFTTVFGQTQELSKEWFSDLAVYADVAADAAKNSDTDGEDVLVVYAVDDQAVNPAVSQRVADLLHAKVVTTPEDGHGYGFYSGNTAILELVCNTAADFFAKELD